MARHEQLADQIVEFAHVAFDAREEFRARAFAEEFESHADMGEGVRGPLEVLARRRLLSATSA
ncbi:MAG: hypothetical protein GY910_07070 [bacterium]|nr:hypothetical protein [bacterium]